MDLTNTDTIEIDYHAEERDMLLAASRHNVLVMVNAERTIATLVGTKENLQMLLMEAWGMEMEEAYEYVWG